jgi:hypothetical protein
VFVGRVGVVDEGFVYFRVTQAWKGVPREVRYYEIFTPHPNACGFLFELDEEYLVYATSGQPKKLGQRVWVPFRSTGFPDRLGMQENSSLHRRCRGHPQVRATCVARRLTLAEPSGPRGLFRNPSGQPFAAIPGALPALEPRDIDTVLLGGLPAGLIANDTNWHQRLGDILAGTYVLRLQDIDRHFPGAPAARLRGPYARILEKGLSNARD